MDPTPNPQRDAEIRRLNKAGVGTGKLAAHVPVDTPAHLRGRLARQWRVVFLVTDARLGAKTITRQFDDEPEDRELEDLAARFEAESYQAFPPAGFRREN